MSTRECPPVIGITGVKNSGKTTLMVKLIEALSLRDLRVASIKHDAHRFDPDVPGRDSWRHRQAGAFASAVFDADKYMLIKDEAQTIEGLLPMMGEADIVLIEGARETPYPKIEVVRQGNSGQAVTAPEQLMALATDSDFALPGVPRVDINDVDTLVTMILNYIKKK